MSPTRPFAPSLHVLTAIALLAMFQNSCVSPPKPIRARPTAPSLNVVGQGPLPDMSGMAKCDDNAYLVVHDVKENKPGRRISRVELTDRSYAVSTVTLFNSFETGALNDLEGICSVPGFNNRFLLLESGSWLGAPAFIFLIELAEDKYHATVVRTFELPLLKQNTFSEVGDNFEGIVCSETDDGRHLVIIGERGGSEAYPSALIRWGSVDLMNDKKIQWADEGKRVIPIVSPLVSNGKRRHITDLFVQGRTVWAAATVDPGDEGPFTSMIYELGVLTGDQAAPINAAGRSQARWILDGIKVEGIGEKANKLKNSTLSIVTDDENYGGVWRPL